MLRVGDVIPLSLQLFDGATDKYVRAVVRDATGTPISGSPFSCTHVAGGQYSNFSGIMPNTAFITAQFKVYDDAGFTTPSSIHSDAMGEPLFLHDERIGTASSELKGIIESVSPLIGIVEEC